MIFCIQSSGPQKEKPMKGKKGKQQKQQQQVQRSAGSAGKNKSANQKGWIAKKTLDDITVQVGSMDFDGTSQVLIVVSMLEIGRLRFHYDNDNKISLSFSLLFCTQRDEQLIVSTSRLLQR